MDASFFKFRLPKAIAATAYFLRRERSRQMNYYRLLKMLYIADRESIRKVGRPMIGGRWVAMDRGPLHSDVYDLIKGVGRDVDEWSNCFARSHYHLDMLSDPGSDELSEFEMELLDAIASERDELDEWAVGDETHSFAEFIKNKDDKPRTSKQIPLEDVLVAVDRTADLDVIVASAKRQEALDKLFKV